MQSNSGNKINARRDTVSIKRPYVLNDMCPSQLFWEMAIHRISFVEHRERHEFWLWKSWWKSWTVPAGSQILMCPSQLQVIFKSSSHISVFISIFIFCPTPAMDTYPAEEHLTPNIPCCRLNGMYPSQGLMCVFHIFCSREKSLRAFWKSTELSYAVVRKAEPTR